MGEVTLSMDDIWQFPRRIEFTWVRPDQKCEILATDWEAGESVQDVRDKVCALINESAACVVAK